MDMQFSDVFWKIYDAASLHPRYISNKGGTRSTKTYSTLQFLHLLIPKADKAGDITSVVSESFPHLKKGAIRDFENIIGHSLKGDPHWNATDNVWTYDNGAKLEFFSVDNAAKVHGSQRKRLFINEANHIAYEIFRQLAVRTSSIIFIDYNPASVCWIQNEVESKQNCILIKSTYKDNPFLSAEQVREIEDQKSDANWWKVYGCGLEGTLDGLIYEFEQIDELPVKTEMDHLVEIQGLDFGFTNDPTARVQVIADPRKKILYVRERCYQTHMQNKHIIQDLQDDGVGRRVEIYADCAEPKSIADIQDAGFNVIPCDKDAPVKSDKLKFQLQWMQGWKLYVTKDSLNLINELRNYTWAKDKDGTLLNQPIDKFNHCFTGDTLVMTDRGLVRIDHIVPGMQVATSDGYHRVVRLWENGCKKIWDITLKFANFEIRMKVTPDHKIKVSEQWKKVSELKAGDRLWKLKSSMGRHIFSTGERDISQKAQRDSTELYGNSITERFLQGIKYTIRMAIRRIMTLATLSVFHSKSILKCIVSRLLPEQHQKNQSSILKRLDNWHPSGTDQKREESGIDCTQWGKESDQHNAPANVVERLSCLPIRIRNSAQTAASQNGEETTTLMMRQESASSVEKNSVPIDIAKQCVVEALVLHSIVINEERNEDVYDLLVDGQHEYFANGILVHNCLDALRYCTWTKFGQRAGYGTYSISFSKRR